MSTTTTASASNGGTTLLNSPSAGGVQSFTTINYSSPQSSGTTGTSTIVTNIAQSGETVSTSGTFVINQTGESSGYTVTGTTYIASAISSSGTPAGVTSITSLATTATQGGSDSYTGETQGSFDGAAASGTFQSTQTSTWGSSGQTGGYAITTAPSGGTKTSYGNGWYANNLAQTQSSGSFGPRHQWVVHGHAVGKQQQL